MGMANLFGLLYSHEARYCPEHKSWYTPITREHGVRTREQFLCPRRLKISFV